MAAPLPAPRPPDGDDKKDMVRLSGPEKAAVLMLALGDEAPKVFALLHEEEIRDLSTAMSSLGLVQAATVEALAVEFLNRIGGSGAIMGSYEHTQRMLASFMEADKVTSIMEEIRGPAGRNIWDKIANVNEEVLASYLRNEYPQTVAVVLSRVRPEHAAKVLSKLPEEFAAECIVRMLNMEPVQREIVEKIETTLRTEFMSNLARTTRRDPHELMADIFNSFDRQTESRFLSALETRAHESADRIRSLMFVFEDLRKLDASGVQTLMRGVDKSDLGLALKGASDEMRNLFLSNMSERGSKILKEEMAAMGPVRLRDVDAAQSRMVAVAKELSARGEIVLSDGKSDDELIY
ncbi:MAG: flagellar motor switch protein FliG [Alphaproteobacteria bacterium]|nr:flagellar motor switch protein FliG [Alphaproteobacteria bacterium]